LVSEPTGPEIVFVNEVELEVPNVRFFVPKLASPPMPLKSPIVIPDAVIPLISNVEAPLTATKPVVEREPPNDRLNVPAVIVVPPE
jgi:hypothetical protein